MLDKQREIVRQIAFVNFYCRKKNVYYYLNFIKKKIKTHRNIKK